MPQFPLNEEKELDFARYYRLSPTEKAQALLWLGHHGTDKQKDDFQKEQKRFEQANQNLDDQQAQQMALSVQMQENPAGHGQPRKRRPGCSIL